LPLVELVKGGLFCGFERLIPQDQHNGHQQESYNDDHPWPLGAFLHLASPSPACTRSGGKHRGIVAFVERWPGAVMDPFAQQGGFAETGRGGDEGEPAMEPRIQLLN